MDNFTKFTYKFRGLINKELSYYNLSYEEKIQECALVYFSDKKVIDLFASGEERKAFSIFKRNLRESARKYSKTGMRVSTNVTYERSKVALDRIESSFDLETNSTEAETIMEIDFNRVKKIINKESFDFIMFYFDNGQMLTSIKYNLTEPTTRKRACRILNKAKGMIDYD